MIRYHSSLKLLRIIIIKSFIQKNILYVMIGIHFLLLIQTLKIKLIPRLNQQVRSPKEELNYL